MHVSTLWAPMLVASIVAVMSNYPPGPTRLARFARRHNLPVNADLTAVREHLRLTRGWRTAGVVVALLVVLGCTVSNQGARVDALPLLVGWLIGALIAEGRAALRHTAVSVRRTRTDIVPRWIHRLPVGLAAVAVGSTAAAAWVRRDPVSTEVVVAWGFAAGGCALVIAFAVRLIGGYRGAQGDAGGETGQISRAIGANSIGAITAVGLLVTWLCLSSQLSAVRTGYFGHVGSTLDGVGWLGGIASLLIAIIVVHASWFESYDQPTSLGSLSQVFAVVVVLLLVATTWTATSIERDHPPYPSAAVNPTATITVTDGEHFEADATALGLTGLPSLAMDNVFIGRLDYLVPAGASHYDRCALVVIDTGSDQVVPYIYGGRGRGGYWASALSEVPRQYPWLSAMSEEARTGQGLALEVDPSVPGSMAFGGTFGRESIVDPAALMVALIFMGPGGQVYWAVRVPVTVR